MKISKVEYNFEKLALATIIDGVNILIWQNTKAARSGKNRPKSVADKMIKGGSDEVAGFDSPEAFEMARARILLGGEENA